MSSTATAKTNNAIIKRNAQLMSDANIIMLIVNHLTTKIDIGGMPSAAVLNYLKQDESMPGGSSAMFMADALLKVVPSTKLNPDKDYGIKGFMVKGEFIKSRSNEAGVPFEMIFNQSKGFDNFYTNFNNLKKLKILQGNGRAYYFDFAPDIKFTQKNVKEIYETNEEFREGFDNLVQEIYFDCITNAGDYDYEGMIPESESVQIPSDKYHKKIEKLPNFNKWYSKEDYIWLDLENYYYDVDGDQITWSEEEESWVIVEEES